MSIKNKIVSAIILPASFMSITAQGPVELNIQKCHQLAIENSRSIKISELQIEKVKGEQLAAKSAWFPKVEASATGLYSKQHIQQELMLPTKTFDMASGQLVPNIAINPMTGAPITTADGTPIFNTYAFLPLDLTLYGGYMAGVSLKQPIYAGGKIVAGNKMAAIAKELASSNRLLKEDELIFETDKLYFNYLAVLEKVKLAEKYQQLLKEVVKILNDSYETGMVTKNELLKAQVKLNEATLGLQKAQSGLKLSGMALCNITGLDLYAEFIVKDSLKFQKETMRVSNAKADARVEYALLSKQLDMAKQEVKMVKGDYLPTFGVSAGYSYFNAVLKDMDDYNSDGFNVIASLKIPLVTFGERKGKIASAKATEKIKRMELQEATSLLQLDIEQARLNYMQAFTRAELSQQAMNQADENMKISDDLFRTGMETLVNVLEAKAEWQKAYSEQIDALADLKISESYFLKVTK